MLYSFPQNMYVYGDICPNLYDTIWGLIWACPCASLYWIRDSMSEQLQVELLKCRRERERESDIIRSRNTFENCGKYTDVQFFNFNASIQAIITIQYNSINL